MLDPTMQSDQNWAASGSASSIPKYECIFQSEPGSPSKTSMRQALASINKEGEGFIHDC